MAATRSRKSTEAGPAKQLTIDTEPTLKSLLAQKEELDQKILDFIESDKRRFLFVTAEKDDYEGAQPYLCTGELTLKDVLTCGEDVNLADGLKVGQYWGSELATKVLVRVA